MMSDVHRATRYEHAAAELRAEAAAYETSTHHLRRWEWRARAVNEGRFMDPVYDSVERTVSDLATATSELRRIARVCDTRASLIREHVAAVRRWELRAAQAPDGVALPSRPTWPFRWRWT